MILGIGGATAVFAFVGIILFKPLPYPDPGRLVRVVHNRPDKARATLIKFSYFPTLRDRNNSFQDVAAYDSYSNLGASQLEATLSTNQGPSGLAGTRVSTRLFPMLGVTPVLGRTFAASEAADGQNHVAVLSYAAWQQNFGGNPAVLRESITVDQDQYLIIGIAPADFAFPDRATQFWIPLNPKEIPPPSVPRTDSPDSAFLEMIARLRPGVSLQAATADAEAIFRSVDQQYDSRGYVGIQQRVELIPLIDEMIAPVRPALSILPFAIGIVLLIVCANVTNLLLARSAARRREIATRVALGASHSRILRQVLAEASVLSAAGGLGGAGFAGAVLGVLSHFAPREMPRVEELTLSVWVVLLAAAVSLVAALASSLLPALRSLHVDQSAVLRGATGARPEGLRRLVRSGIGGVIIAAQVAMAVVLLVGAGLMIRSLVRLSAVDPGYDARHVLVSQIVLPADRYAPDFYSALLDRLKVERQVQFAGTTDKLPIVGAGGLFLSLGGLPVPGADDRLVMRVVSQDYLRAMGTPVLRGRGFETGDVQGSPPVVLINETLARRHFGDQNPLGALVYQGSVAFRIVGVVRDIRHGGLDVTPTSEYFLDLRQSPVVPLARPYLVVRATGDPASVVPILRAAVQQIEPRALLDPDLMTMREIVSTSIARPTFFAFLLGIIGCVAVALASLGISGLVGYLVAKRTSEFGIRLALGAAPRNILGLVFRDVSVLLVAGLGVGLVGAAIATRALRTMLFGITSLDPTTFVLAVVVLAVIAGVATYLPARRATRVDPLVALRAE